MARQPELGNVKLYPQRPLRDSDQNGFVLQFYCPIQGKRIRKNTGTRNRREGRQILRECQQRLLNGEYVRSGGTITEQQAKTRASVQQTLSPSVHVGEASGTKKTWRDCKEKYLLYKRKRVRERSYSDIVYRLDMAERILTGNREDTGLEGSGSINEACTLESMEYLQDRLLEGDECRYDYRSPMTVNTTIGAIMTFVRYCARHEWIEKVPMIEQLDVDEAMKGRPITQAEFDKMIEVTPDVVGSRPAESWQFTLKILWETAFRVGDVMNFAWRGSKMIHPIWPDDRRKHPTLAIPSTQKNGKVQEIPMLPELSGLLQTISEKSRVDWIVNPQPMDALNRTQIRPNRNQLTLLAMEFSNCAIARAFEVTETAVRKWMDKFNIQPNGKRKKSIVPKEKIESIKLHGCGEIPLSERLTKERVGRVISLIGREAKIIVQVEDKEAKKRLKFASAHDIRRGCAERLINQGVTAETLKLVLRHSNFATTEKFYGAVKDAQAAAAEIHLLSRQPPASNPATLSEGEISKLRKILEQM